MKARFVCKKHDVMLLGWPLWDLLDAEPDVYTVSFRDMHCPESPADNIITKCSDSQWEIEVE